MTCPLCGHRAWADVCWVFRPGQPPVLRTTLRCLAPRQMTAHGQAHKGCPPQITEEIAPPDVEVPPYYM